MSVSKLVTEPFDTVEARYETIVKRLQLRDCPRGFDELGSDNFNLVIRMLRSLKKTKYEQEAIDITNTLVTNTYNSIRKNGIGFEEYSLNVIKYRSLLDAMDVLDYLRSE